MPEQLGLFDRRPQVPAAPEPVPAEAPEPAPLAGTGARPTDARQGDLFGDRWLRARAVLAALEVFDLDLASEELAKLAAVYPDDAAMGERTAAIEELARAFADARRATTTRADALLAIETHVPVWAEQAWRRHLAETIEREAGPGGEHRGVPAGLHWLRAGDGAQAEASLRALLARDPSNARVRAYLGDALFFQENRYAARVEYRDALAMAPGDVDLESLLDREVADVTSIAEFELELPGPPLEWCAAVGVLDGVFALPKDTPPGWTDAAALASLPSGLRFYRWLVAEFLAESDDERLACRRAMKGLSPQLLERLLRRRR